MSRTPSPQRAPAPEDDRTLMDGVVRRDPAAFERLIGAFAAQTDVRAKPGVGTVGQGRAKAPAQPVSEGRSS